MKFFPLFILFFLIMAAVLITLLTLEIIKQKSPASRGKRRAHAPGRSAQIPSDLLVLLQGNRKTAQRLIHFTQRSNPGRSHQWVIEKVIHDLERDRR